MASGVNLEEKSGVGFPKAVCRCTQPHSGNSCDVAGAKLLFLWIHHRHGEGGGGGGGGGGGMLHGQQPVLKRTLPRLTFIQSPTPTSTPGEDTPASPSAWTQHGEQQIPVISHRSISVEHGARGCSRRWERSSDLNGQLSPASSWTAPSQ